MKVVAMRGGEAVVSNDSGFFLFNPHVPRASTKLSVRKSNA
jgi:hypothetical protein